MQMVYLPLPGSDLGSGSLLSDLCLEIVFVFGLEGFELDNAGGHNTECDCGGGDDVVEHPKSLNDCHLSLHPFSYLFNQRSLKIVKTVRLVLRFRAYGW